MSAAENSDTDSNKLESVIQVRHTGPSSTPPSLLKHAALHVCDVTNKAAGLCAGLFVVEDSVVFCSSFGLVRHHHPHD